MTDEQLRALVRESIARHLGTRPRAPEAPRVDGRAHASHLLLPVTSGSEDEGACLIEPAVRCNHCGYCQSFGH